MEINSIAEVEDITKRKKNIIEINYTNIELKSSWDQKNGKKISGLANRINSYPSFLVIGIDDNGNYLDKDANWAKTTEESISNHFNQYLDPLQTSKKISCFEYELGKFIIIIEFISPNAVVFWNQKPYKMSGTTCEEMSPEEVMELSIKFPSRYDFTGQAIEHKYDDNLVKIFIKRIEEKFKTPAFEGLSSLKTVEALSHLKIINKQVSRLLFGDAQFRVVFFNNDNSVDNQITYSGLINIINGILWKDISEWLDKKYSIKSHILYPLLAVEETLANAVAHAAHFVNDGEIIIEVYFDKLVISNLCLPESGYFANKWFSRSHNTTNKLLMEILRISRYVDELGRGKYLIYSEFLKSGKKPPEVYIESAGRCSRWKTYLFGDVFQDNYRRAFDSLKSRYGEGEKSQLAFSLVLWRGKTVAEIKKYIDGDSADKLIEILKDFKGPVFFYEKEDKITLNRWMRLIIEEGVDSKTFSPSEEENLYKFSYNMSNNFESGIISPQKIREYGDMGNSRSASTQSSRLLTKWKEEGKVISEKKSGFYRFVERNKTNTDEVMQSVLSQLTGEQK